MAAEVAAAADARPQAGPERQGGRCWSCLCPERSTGHYELATEELTNRPVAAAFDELAMAI
jgi:hypothetical protein